ncbi:MAG: hypothetical protein J7518_16175 [Nocardioidaceae bacterium]|nr:hypothetical protein [Nocardioidaceae bacterium]
MTRSTTMLRRLALTTGLAGAAAFALAPAAEAGAPTRIDAEYWGVTCVTALEDGQTLFLFGSGTTDGTEGGVGAFVEDADGTLVAEGNATAFGFGPAFTAEVDLGGRAFTVAADVTATGSVTEPVDERDGNRWTKGVTTRTELALTPATATYDGVPVELGPQACNGDVNAFDVRTTNPSAYVHRDTDFDSEICAVEGLADAEVRVTGQLPNAYVEVVLDHGDGHAEKAQGEVRVRGGRGALVTDLVDLGTGEVRTAATVGLVLERLGSRTREVDGAGGATERRTLTSYAETVTVALADGRQGIARCRGIAVDTQLRIAPAH